MASQLLKAGIIFACSLSLLVMTTDMKKVLSVFKKANKQKKNFKPENSSFC